MLEKVVGVNLVDKLRTTLPMEADFNFVNGLFLANVLWQCLQKRKLSPVVHLVVKMIAVQ